MIQISAESLVEATSVVASRYRIGVRPHTAIIAEVIKASENKPDLDNFVVSRTTTHRKRFKTIENLGDWLRSEIMLFLKGKRLMLHFDGKQIQEIHGDLNITVTVERIAVSVTSPDFPDSNDVLLGVVQAESSKGGDQTEVIHNLL